MSKIVFINPAPNEFWNSKLLNLLKGKRQAFLPRLSAMIFAALTPEKHSFTYVDEEIGSVDYNMEADLVAITAMTKQAVRAYLIAGEFRKRGIPVIIGGIHAGTRSEEVSGHCDAVMIGEGENTWPAMLEDFENGALKKVYDAKDYPPVEKLVSPRIDIINPDHYVMYPLQATRGCPYDCEFCSIKYSTGHKYRTKPVEQVVAEIREYEKVNTRQFSGVVRKGYYFTDDNIYVDREYLKKLLTAIKPLGIIWEAEGSANVADDDEILQLMGESGCRTFSIGFESVNPNSLSEANKPKVNKVEQYHETIAKLAKYGIIPGGNFVVGFDSDDVTVFETMLDFIKNSDLAFVIVSILTPYPGTRLYERMKPRIFETDSRFYDSWQATFTPRNMTAQELQIGWYWMGTQFTDLDFMWTQMKKYWNYGPWKNIPVLTLRERLLLIITAIVLGMHGMFKYQKFLWRAAFYPKTTDFNQLIWNMRRLEMSSNGPAVRNPADKYRERGVTE
ncbi:MAG: B12-binding domain-containing radical SAM protein [Clostridiales bacterium]|jgi:radical SAM superfamily enzyme YgiQ (UPF0313 family)|nr:B12-binding domain-containing radical SAM protein [Clostridiales bacterium]